MYGFTGKAFDSATGLYDYGFRDYSPNSARFTTVDPVRDGSNWFCYVVNDPVNYIDPFGLNVVNNSDSPIIIKLEREGYVILAPGAKYDGYDVVGAKKNPLDIKIDGIIFADGRIEKFSDSDKLSDEYSVSVTVNADSSVNKTDFVSYLVDAICNLGKLAENIGIWWQNVCDGKGLFSKEGFKEYSGTYHANDGSETGKWSRGQLSESAMNDTLNGSNAVYIESKKDLNQMLAPVSSSFNNSVTGSNISFGTSGIYGDVSIIPNYSTLNSNNFGIKNVFMNGSVIQNFIKPSVPGNLANFAINSVTSGITMGGCSK